MSSNIMLSIMAMKTVQQYSKPFAEKFADPETDYGVSVPVQCV